MRGTVVVTAIPPGHPPAGAGMMSPSWSPWPFKPLRSTVISTKNPADVAWQIVILPRSVVVEVEGLSVVGVPGKVDLVVTALMAS